MKIKLTTIKDVNDCINALRQVPHDVKAKQDSYIVDAKSILGIFSLDLMRPIEIDCDLAILDRFKI